MNSPESFVSGFRIIGIVNKKGSKNCFDKESVKTSVRPNPDPNQLSMFNSIMIRNPDRSFSQKKNLM